MASGIVAAVVFPNLLMLRITLSSDRFRRSAVALMMRRFAWCAMKISTLFERNSVPFQQQGAVFAHLLHGVLENLLTLLVNVVHLLFDGFVRCRAQTATGGHVEEFAAGAVDLTHEIDDAFAFRAGSEKNSAGAIAEKHARVRSW